MEPDIHRLYLELRLGLEPVLIYYLAQLFKTSEVMAMLRDPVQRRNNQQPPLGITFNTFKFREGVKKDQLGY